MICEFIWRSWLALKLTTRSGSLYCLHDKVADPTASFSSDEHLCVSRQSLTDTELFQFEWVPDQSKSEYDHPWWRFSTAWYGTVRYGSLLGGFPLGTVPGTWYVFSTHFGRGSIEPYRYQNVTWKLCWPLIGRRKSSLLRHWTCDTRPSSTALLPARFKSAQPAKDRTQLLFKQTHILHQAQNSSVVVCWGSTDVPLVDGRGADPARAWWRDAEGKSLMYITLLLNLLYFQSMFSVYILPLYLCFASIKNNLIE